MRFVSKYSKEEIEGLLDKVQTGNGGSNSTKEVSYELDSFLRPGVIYITFDPSVQIDGFEYNDSDSYLEYHVFFEGQLGYDLVLPDYVQWANGKIPEVNLFGWNELSIIKVGTEDSGVMFLAVLANFNFVS